MTKVALIAAIAGLFTVQHNDPVLAQELRSSQMLKPLQGISFNFGPKRAVSYFTRQNGRCKLVLTMADQPDLEARHSVTTFNASRFEADVPGGKAARYVSDFGKAIEFTCLANAEGMTIVPVNRLTNYKR